MKIPDNTSLSNDHHSFSRPESAVVQHLNLNLQVDFRNKTLRGTATYNLIKQPEATQIILDTRDLVIESVLLEEAAPTTFYLTDPEPFLGQALHIDIKPDTKSITVHYQTKPEAAALQWLEPAQTAGKQYPFLFTQSQAILARTWLPVQDSPGIRFTYQAQVQVPANFIALMSAENPQQKNNTGLYHFAMHQPVPAYLMALAVGDLAFKEISSNTGIYAEPVMLAAAYHEFEELPQMLHAAENLYGKYLWERYDLLLLPPSFPFGGMENPRLTFVTPTIITGDRSLTSLVAHELAHSWSGNLVTNATWNDFWLNEGFTVYFERRIMEALYGKDDADMLKVLGYQDLQHTLQEIGPKSPDTHLKLNLAGRDPDEGLTEIAYEKGNLFLLKIEEVVGRSKFDAFIRDYFQKFAFQSMNTENFLLFLKENLLAANPTWLNKVNPEAWIYAPGIPAHAPVLVSGKFKQVNTQIENFCHGSPAVALATQSWTTQEWLYFLNCMAAGINLAQAEELDAAFRFTQTPNAEIAAIWFKISLPLGYSAINPNLEEFLLRVGRRKFVLPLYQALIKQDQEKAVAIYKKARANYHAVTTSSLNELLK